MLIFAGAVLASIVFLIGYAYAASAYRHIHQWKITSCTYTPPQAMNFSGRGYNAMKIMYDLTHGFTVVSMVCSYCGEPRTEKFQGKYIPPKD